MVVDKTLDKYLADIVLSKICNGFEYNSEIKRYQLKISHITEPMFKNMANRASVIGKTLTVETVNTLLEWTQKDAFYCEEFLYSLPVKLLGCGEAIRIRCQHDGIAHFADLMKMTESEFLVLQTDLKILKEQQVMQIYANDNIGKGESVYIPSYGKVKVLQSWILMPLEYHYYADWHFMRDLWRYNVVDNLWFTYNALTEFINMRITWEKFINIMDLFKKNGLSTFVFRMMLNSMKR